MLSVGRIGLLERGGSLRKRAPPLSVRRFGVKVNCPRFWSSLRAWGLEGCTGLVTRGPNRTPDIDLALKPPATKRIETVVQNGKATAAAQTKSRVRKGGTARGGTPTLRVLPPAAVSDYAARKRRSDGKGRGRVLVVDEHPMVEEWIGTLVGEEADVVLARHAAELADTPSLVTRGRPGLVLLEIAKNVPRGLEIVRTLKAKFPKVRMLVFSSCDESAHALHALRAGAHGFVSKGASGVELLRAIRHVMADGVYLSSAMIAHLAASSPDSALKTGPGELLSQRELEVFVFIGEGMHPMEIGQRMALSVKTVESYLARIREKLSLRDARALFQSAVKWSRTRAVTGAE